MYKELNGERVFTILTTVPIMIMNSTFRNGRNEVMISIEVISTINQGGGGYPTEWLQRVGETSQATIMTDISLREFN